MLVVKILRSLYLQVKIKSLNIEKAKNLPGIEYVLTIGDMKKYKVFEKIHCIVDEKFKTNKQEHYTCETAAAIAHLDKKNRSK